MLRRHPHVFGSEEERADGKKDGSWEQIKENERSESNHNSALAGRGVHEKIQEELGELEEAVGARDSDNMEEEFGDLLFAVVNLARHLKIDPEKALNGANYKFERRFRDMEDDIGATGKRFRDFNLETLESFWRVAKKRVG